MKKIADRVVSRAVSVRWAHGHVPTQYIKIFVALHPQFQRPVYCVPTQYLVPPYSTGEESRMTPKN